MVSLIKGLFKISMFLFILLGIIMVVSQLAGLVVADGSFMVRVYKVISPYAFIIAAISGFLAFLLSYSNKNTDSQNG